MQITHGDWIWSLAFSPDSSRLLTGGLDRAVKLWDLAGSQCLYELHEHQGAVSAISFSPDGRQFVTGCKDGYARLWETTTGQLLHAWNHPGQEVWDAAFVGEGDTVLTATNTGSLHVWHRRDGTASSLRLLPHQGSVNDLAFSPDGRRVITVSQDHTARLWKVATGGLLGVMQHERDVQTAVFGPDGRFILTGGNERAARLWDGEKLKPIGGPFEHANDVKVVAFGADGRRFLTTCLNGMTKCWPVPQPIQGAPERVLLWAEAITEHELDASGVIRGLSSEEWQKRKLRLAQMGGPPVE